MARMQATASDALRLDASREPPVISSAPEIGPHRAVRNDTLWNTFSARTSGYRGKVAAILEFLNEMPDKERKQAVTMLETLTDGTEYVLFAWEG
jgi:hypothetical protein